MSDNCVIVDAAGRDVAEIRILDVEEGWYYGTISQDQFLDNQRQALEWYDEVVAGQMISYLDDALAAVDGLRLQARFSGSRSENIFSMHVSKNGDVSFRTTPVPPPLGRTSVAQDI